MSENTSLPVLSLVGLGKLGAPIATAIAHRGFKVYGVDLSDRVVQMINAQEDPVQETNLNNLLKQTEGRLSASKATVQAVLDSDITIILVPTPSTSAGEFSLKYVHPVCQKIGEGIALKDQYHLVVLTSTVSPESTEGPVKATIEHFSGKKCGEGWGLCYSPEFVALGSVIEDFLHPDFLLIGESDNVAGQYWSETLYAIIQSSPPVVRTDFVNAELIKLALNCYMTVKITYANFLGRLCEKLSGADVDRVTSALGHDGRISPKYMKGGAAYGGPCFPRDTMALAALAERLGVDSTLPEMIEDQNQDLIHDLIEKVGKLLPRGTNTVGILGLAYKPGTTVLTESAGWGLAKRLAGILESQSRIFPKGHVLAYDPMGTQEARSKGISNMGFPESLRKCVARSDVLIVMNNCPEFKIEEWPELEGKAVIDCWRLFDPSKVPYSVTYVPVGRG